MPVFALVAGGNSEQSLASKVKVKYPDSGSMSIDNGNWLVFDAELITPKEVCDKILGENNVSERLLVVPVESYWGIHDNKVWAWLGSKKL